jgi:hypothetical protein
MQSAKVCFARGIFMMKDAKVTYHKYLRNIFADAKHLRLEGVPGLGWLTFSVAEPQDIKSFQLCLGRGGACKGTN